MGSGEMEPLSCEVRRVADVLAEVLREEFLSPAYRKDARLTLVAHLHGYELKKVDTTRERLVG